jgi:hypothetical protein
MPDRPRDTESLQFGALAAGSWIRYIQSSKYQITHANTVEWPDFISTHTCCVRFLYNTVQLLSAVRSASPPVNGAEGKLLCKIPAIQYFSKRPLASVRPPRRWPLRAAVARRFGGCRRASLVPDRSAVVVNLLRRRRGVAVPAAASRGYSLDSILMAIPMGWYSEEYESE